MLTFHHAPRTRSGRILWLMEEVGAPFTLSYTDVVRGDGTGRAGPGNVHPDGKVPALDHDGVVISESLAIALYMVALQPEAGLGAKPGTAEFGAYLTWMCWVTGELEPAIWARLSGQVDDAGQKRFDQVMARILKALALGPYLMGERFTAVDVMVGSLLTWARAAAPESAVIDAYLARLNKRPALARAVARDEPVAA